MKLPSLTYLAQSAWHSFMRFPLTILSSLVSVCIGIYLAEEHDNIPNMFPYINGMLCTALGISLFFCTDVYVSHKGFSKQVNWGLRLLATCVLVILYFTFPDSDSTQNTSLPYIRYAIYSITIHLLVAFVPFIGTGHLNGFWHHNKILFVRFLTSLLYSAFLYGGLALALGSLVFLFDIDLHEELFLDLFILISGFFNTWFFISGIPERFDTLEEIREYPRGIKIFSQYILLPLLILYLFILYGYATKIVVLWSWPKGIVSYLIACVAVLGILTLLLIHPYGNLSGNTWIKKFSRAYYFILFPLVILLFVAIGMRVADYGITINRYVILLLGVWLTIVCVYFAIGKTNIKFIPVSLAVILLVVSFGYWGMFSVSERSQVNRLRTILEQGKILSSGKIQREVTWIRDSLPSLNPAQEENTNNLILSDSLHNEVYSILEYLDDHHGFASIREWYAQDIDSIARLTNNKGPKHYYIGEDEIYMRSMGLRHNYVYPTSENSYFSYTTNENNNVIDIRNYDYMVQFSKYQYNERNGDGTIFNIGDYSYTISYAKLPSNKFLMVHSSDTISFDTGDIIKKLIPKYGRKYEYNIPGSEMRLYGSSARFEAKIELNSISFDGAADSLKVTSLSGNIFLKTKK